jgi:hypothetical protein
MSISKILNQIIPPQAEGLLSPRLEVGIYPPQGGAEKSASLMGAICPGGFPGMCGPGFIPVISG